MIAIIRLTAWSFPLVWAAIAVLAALVGYLYWSIYGMRKTLFTPKEVARLFDLYEEALEKIEDLHFCPKRKRRER